MSSIYGSCEGVLNYLSVRQGALFCIMSFTRCTFAKWVDQVHNITKSYRVKKVNHRAEKVEENTKICSLSCH